MPAAKGSVPDVRGEIRQQALSVSSHNAEFSFRSGGWEPLLFSCIKTEKATAQPLLGQLCRCLFIRMTGRNLRLRLRSVREGNYSAASPASARRLRLCRSARPAVRRETIAVLKAISIGSPLSPVPGEGMILPLLSVQTA